MSEISGYDVVGDIGGNLSAFNKLTQKLGYEKVSGHLRHPDARILVSVGDIVKSNLVLYLFVTPLVTTLP